MPYVKPVRDCGNNVKVVVPSVFEVLKVRCVLAWPEMKTTHHAKNVMVMPSLSCIIFFGQSTEELSFINLYGWPVNDFADTLLSSVIMKCDQAFFPMNFDHSKWEKNNLEENQRKKVFWILPYMTRIFVWIISDQFQRSSEGVFSSENVNALLTFGSLEKLKILIPSSYCAQQMHLDAFYWLLWFSDKNSVKKRESFLHFWYWTYQMDVQK